MVELYESKNVKDYVSGRFNHDLYQYALRQYRENNFFPNRHIIKLVFLYILENMLKNQASSPKADDNFISIVKALIS